MVETSENKEAAIVLVGDLCLAGGVLIGALPIPVEIKVPAVTFLGSAWAAVRAFWKAKVNTK